MLSSRLVFVALVTKYSIKTRLASLFVLAFVCLNAGGALCVAYCRAYDAELEAEHCPLKKLDDHCDKAGEGKTGDSASLVASREMDCCPMTVSFFAAPLENRATQFAAEVEAIAVTKIAAPTAKVLRLANLFLTYQYRGPPPLDRRVERIKHRLLLI